MVFRYAENCDILEAYFVRSRFSSKAKNTQLDPDPIQKHEQYLLRFTKNSEEMNLFLLKHE